MDRSPRPSCEESNCQGKRRGKGIETVGIETKIPKEGSDLLPEAPRRAANIREKAFVFSEQGYKKTAGLLSQIACSVEDGKAVELDEIVGAFAIFREEYVSGDKELADLNDFISEVFSGSILSVKSGFRERLEQLEPLLKRWQQTTNVWGLVTNLIMSAVTNAEQQFYGTCLVYAMEVEGQFDEACRLLYTLYAISKAQDPKLADVWEMKVWKIREQLNYLKF